MVEARRSPPRPRSAAGRARSACSARCFLARWLRRRVGAARRLFLRRLRGRRTTAPRTIPLWWARSCRKECGSVWRATSRCTLWGKTSCSIIGLIIRAGSLSRFRPGVITVGAGQPGSRSQQPQATGKRWKIPCPSSSTSVGFSRVAKSSRAAPGSKRLTSSGTAASRRRGPTR